MPLNLLGFPSHKARMVTVTRVMIVALISFLHLVSLLLLTLSLALGSGGLVEAGAIGVDWLALIVVAAFVLHRIRYPQRDFIRPRSLLCFSALTVTSAANFFLFIARLITDDRGLIRDFDSLRIGRAAAFSAIAIAGVTLLLGVFGLYVSYTGCYVEARPKPRPFISRPIFDWHPPLEVTPSPMSAAHLVELRHVHVKDRYGSGALPRATAYKDPSQEKAARRCATVRL